MLSIEEYRFCLNIIKKNKKVFNAFDVISLFDIYFDKITFYTIISNDLNNFSSDLGIINITKNFSFIVSSSNEYSFIWKFID